MMVRHANDHVHVVVCRVSDEGTVWHGRNDRRAAQSACTRLELEHGLQTAPRRRGAGRGKRSVLAVRQQQEQQAQVVAARRAEWEQIRKFVELDNPAPRKRTPAPQQHQRVAPLRPLGQAQHLRRPGPGREDHGRGLQLGLGREDAGEEPSARLLRGRGWSGFRGCFRLRHRCAVSRLGSRRSLWCVGALTGEYAQRHALGFVGDLEGVESSAAFFGSCFSNFGAPAPFLDLSFQLADALEQTPSVLPSLRGLSRRRRWPGLGGGMETFAVDEAHSDECGHGHPPPGGDDGGPRFLQLNAPSTEGAVEPLAPGSRPAVFLTGHGRERKGALSLGRVLAVARPWQFARASLPGEQDQEAIMPWGSMMYFSCELLSKSA